jgi:predicted aspartyl protease
MIDAIRICIVLVCLIAAQACSWAATSNEEFRALYDAREWFRLRDAVAGTDAPPFYRGAVALAFHESSTAEKYLRQAIKSAPASREAIDARRLLATSYSLAGRYRRAILEYQAIQAILPDNAGVKYELNELTVWSRYPEPSVKKRQRSRIPCQVKDGNLFVPVSINGKEAHYFIETGSNNSFISEGEARRAGMTVDEAPGLRTHDASGTSGGYRIAVANDLVVGGFHLKNMTFLVFRDDQLPLELPPGWRGALGLPVLVAIGTVRWNREGSFEIGFPSAAHGISNPNLCLSGEGPMLVVQGTFEGAHIQVLLDTGATYSQLLPSFAKDFSKLVQDKGKKKLTRIRGVNGTKEVETIMLPGVRVRFGNFDVALEPAEVLSKDSPFGASSYHVWSGLDLLQQARQVTIDFLSMRLAME